MDRLNYHHLLYFWTVARYGGLGRAADELRLSRSTLSAQIHQLEDVTGHQLLRRSGRSLALTDKGQIVFEYCDRMFSIGRELGELMDSVAISRPKYLRIGVAEVIPRLVVGRLLRPVLALPTAFRLICREGQSKRLLAELAVQNLDLVIDDTPVGTTARIRGFSHKLGESGVAMFGTKALVARYKAKFPKSLDGAPVLLPSEGSALRESLDRWFENNKIRPEVVGECDDRDLLEVFGQSGIGLFPAPTVIRRELTRDYNVHYVGNAIGIREGYYAITIQRQIAHPAISVLLGLKLTSP